MTSQDAAVYVSAIAAVVGAAYTALSFHRPRAAPVGDAPQEKRNWSPFWPVILVLVGWGAVAVNYWVGNHSPAPIIPTTQPDPSKVFLQTWGMLPPATYQVTVNGAMIQQYKDKFKLVLVTRTQFSDIDRMTDTYLEKSQPYTIEDGLMVLAHPSSNKLRFLIDRPTAVEYDVAMIPAQFSPDQINTLQDIEKLGGRILAGAANTVTVTKPQPQIPYVPPCFK